ncbi:aryl hydrocarbon receptor-like isoform X1 [Zonotrichia leucophrys gambelii]|uniref:aryl hydrocarbon receptor-like isoform X1 n=1 Tax=Zonotrichia leucophrys gambelii TaxID=257770 RepID=UPI003140A704
MYAGRRRRKPVPRATRPGPAEGGGSNPSKRHRERLNRELERLAGLLPFPPDVVAGLDKLSVLRLSAGFLRARSFLGVALKNPGAKEAQRDGACGAGPALGSAAVPEGELLLQALNGFVLVVTSEGLIFYSSHTIQDYLGFHQTDVMHQSVFELIHTEDQPEFRRNLRWALDAGEPSAAAGKSLSSSAGICKPDQLPPENSSFLERSFVCRFRCLLDNSSGFLALNLQGRLKFLHGQKERSEDGSVLPPQLALFAISTPLQPPSILQIRTKNMIFRTKHKLDFTPLACDAKGKIVLGYTEAELRMCGTGYQFVHAADMLYCAENHVRMMQTGESGLTVFRLLTKDKRWKWVQANARLVYRNGKPEYIVVTQRPLVDEEGGEHLRKRSMHLPFTFATGEALLYQSSHPLPGFPDLFQSKGKLSKSKKPPCSHAGRSQRNGIDPRSLLGAVMQQDEAVYTSHSAPIPNPSFSSTFQLKGVSLPGAGGDAWGMGTAPASSRGNSLQEKLLDLQQEDPLLATMDLLSIKSDQSCSNELFSALEGLGLNAEDLGLLLLDEKMVMVRTDPDQSPSLNNSLASNQILSHVPRPPADGHEGGQQVCPLPGTPPSPQGGPAPCHMEDEHSGCHLAQRAGQPRTALPQPQPHTLLWEQPPSAVPGLLPELAEQEELSSGSQWRPAGEETVLHSFQPVRGTPWHSTPSSAPGAPCPQEPPGAQQLQGGCSLVQPLQEDAQQSFCLSSQRQDHAAPPSQPRHHHLLMNGLCGPSCSPQPSPWQDCVCPLLRAPAQPGVPGLSRDGASQPQGCPGPGPGLPPQQFHLDGLCSLDAAGPGDSWQEMAPYPRIFPPFYQLVPEKQLSSVLSVPQHSSPSSAAGHFGSISSPLETLNSYGTRSQEGRHRPHSGSGLPSSAMALPQDHPVLGGSLALPCQPQPRAEVLPDPPHASRRDFYL